MSSSGRTAFSAALALLFATSVFAQTNAAKPAHPAAAPAASIARMAPRIQGADRCLGDPKFIERLGMSRRAVVDTTQVTPVGMLVADVDANGQRGRTVQHETWARAGYLGAVQRDAEGNLFVHPAPSFTIEKNPPERANMLYRVDSFSGEMKEFVEIEKRAPAGAQNPFGIMAMTYDCASRSLYVASVFGSRPGTANGTISLVETGSGKAKVLLAGFDPFSLVVTYFPEGKRLLYASAREPVVYSRAISANGELADDERVEVQLDDWVGLGDRKARRLRIDPQGRLLVRVQPFDFALSASSVIARAELVYDYDNKTRQFKLSSSKETPVTVHNQQ